MTTSRGSTADLLAAAAISAITTTCAAPVVRTCLVRLDVLDQPNHRSSHSVAVPRGGGVACAAGTWVGLTAYARRTGDRAALRVLGPSATLFVVGLADDVFSLPAWARLLFQGLVGSAVAVPTTPAGRMSAAANFIAVVNAVNFMDGINGISALTALAWGSHAALGQVAYSPGAAVAGAAAGFLPWNAPHARLFLGDSGSYLIGALMATSFTDPLWRDRRLDLVIPLAPYAADAISTLVRRAAAGRNLLEAHREHAYQRLVHDCGFSHAQVALAHAALVVVISTSSRHLRPSSALAAAGLAAAAWASSPAIVVALRSRLLPVGRHLRTADGAGGRGGLLRGAGVTVRRFRAAGRR